MSVRSPLIALLLLAALPGCGISEGDKAAVVQGYGEVVSASYDATLAAATDMQGKIDAFVAAPSAAGLTAAQDAWLAARDVYGQTEAYRFYDGPIDAADSGPEGYINAWPMDESYIDYVVDGEGAILYTGIINTPGDEITEAHLRDLNEQGSETNIATGWHAIEFLLWGQDLNPDGPGQRSFQDYVDGNQANADRRRAYLSLVTQMLVDDLTYLSEAWVEGGDNYRASFEHGDVSASLANMLRAIGTLSKGELAQERIFVAYSERNQEDEHSCFSDNTLADIYANALGVQNVWMGRFEGVSADESPASLVASVDAELEAQVTARTQTCLDTISSIPAPFDQWLTTDVPDSDPGRQAILASVECLEDLGDEIVLAGAALGYENLDISLE